MNTQFNENIQNSAEENQNNSKYGDSYEPLNETPFSLVQQKGKWFITMAEYKITDEYETDNQALEELNYNKWHIILRMISAVIHKQQNLKQNA